VSKHNGQVYLSSCRANHPKTAHYNVLQGRKIRSVSSIWPSCLTQFRHRLKSIESFSSEGAETTFDWFLKPSYLIPLLEPFLPKGKSTRILMLGCGNSTLGEEMYDAGYHDIVNIDVSRFETSAAIGNSITHPKYMNCSTLPT
jgi:hypothetical protein